MRTGTMQSLAAAAVLIALLAACGGSDDSGPAIDVTYAGPTGPAPISEAAVGALVTNAASATQGLSGVSGGYVTMTGASRAPAAGVKQAMERIAAARGGGASLVGAVYPGGGPCPGGGSESVRMYDGDDDFGTTSPGDWAEISFDRCVDDYGDMADGAIRLTILATNGGDPFYPDSVWGTATFAFSATFADFAIIEAGGAFAGLNGDVTFDYTVTNDGYVEEIEYEISGQSIVAVEGYSGAITASFLLAGLGGAPYSETLLERYDGGFFYAPIEIEWGFEGRMCSTEIGGCIDVAIAPPFAMSTSEGYPYEGTLRVSVATGAFVEVVAVGGGYVEVSWDVDGPAGPSLEQGPFTTTWSCLETEADSSACFP